MRNDEIQKEGLETLCNELVTDRSLVVEIGSYSGESASIFARHAKRVYCIDPWVDMIEEGATADGSNFHYSNMYKAEIRFDLRMEGLTNVVKIRGFSDEVAEVFANRSVDLVYIDALHQYETVRTDIAKWWKKIKFGGHLAGHNYHDYWPGVVQAVNEAFRQPDHIFVDTSWSVKKIKNRRERHPHGRRPN